MPKEALPTKQKSPQRLPQTEPGPALAVKCPRTRKQNRILLCLVGETVTSPQKQQKWGENLIHEKEHECNRNTAEEPLKGFAGFFFWLQSSWFMKLRKCIRVDGRREGKKKKRRKNILEYWDWWKGKLSSAPVTLKATNKLLRMMAAGSQKQYPVFPVKFFVSQNNNN